jgi:hypothetical protein
MISEAAALNCSTGEGYRLEGGGRRRIKGRYNRRLPSVSFALGLKYM